MVDDNSATLIAAAYRDGALRDTTGLLKAPQFGHLFESFVLMEVRKLSGPDLD